MRYSKRFIQWLRNHDRSRERCRYRRKPHHKKKVPRGTLEAWREHKQLRRDKARRHRRSRKYKQFCKKYSWRSERRWINRQIEKENWDEMIQDHVKHHCDPWMWD